MSKAKDVAVDNTDVEPRQHAVIKNALTGRRKFPFKVMALGDYFELPNKDEALAVHNSLRTYYRALAKKLLKPKKFTVRPNGSGLWVCRRVL